MLSAESWNSLFRTIEPLMRKRFHYRNIGENFHKVADIFAAGGDDALCILMGSHWTDPASLVIGASAPLRAFTGPSQAIRGLQPQESMMYFDMIFYLPDDILVKVDRASMGVLLDYRVVELAWRMPLSMKIRNGSGKWLLKQLLYKYVPAALIDRPKMGFGVPIDAWLRGPLREWAENLLDEKKLLDQGFLKPDPLREKWNQHLSGKYDWHFRLWDVLMFQAWLEWERQRP
jgi:asparagine synthase (glutamine-hydrolysing)